MFFSLSDLISKTLDGRECLGILMISAIQMPKENAVRTHMSHVILFLLNEMKTSHASHYFFDSLGHLPEGAKKWMHDQRLTSNAELRPASVHTDLFWSILDYRTSFYLNQVNKRYSKFLSFINSCQVYHVNSKGTRFVKQGQASILKRS